MEKTPSTSSPQFIWRTTGELMPCKRPELYSKQNGNCAVIFRCCANMIVASNITRAYQHFLIVPVMASLFEQMHLRKLVCSTLLRLQRIWNLDIDLPSGEYQSPCSKK